MINGRTVGNTESGTLKSKDCRFFLEHLDSFRDPSAFLAATRLLQAGLLTKEQRWRKNGGRSSLF